MLKGRLGLEQARQPHSDRHGLLYLERGALSVEDGCLRFIAAGSDLVAAGDYRVPHQSVSFVLLGPGSTVSHDVFRLLARHGTGLSAIGEDGVRLYTAQPLMPDSSALARAQVRAWADSQGERMMVARQMYAWRLGEVLPHRDIAVLRGIEGARMKEIYRLTAEQMNIRWMGRRYDRQDPLSVDLPNQALNHAASAVEAAAAIAVAATAAIPQLGFVHEDSGQSFILDVADLFRDTLTVPCAFKATQIVQKHPSESIERMTRRTVGERLRRERVIPTMIDRIKALFTDGELH